MRENRKPTPSKSYLRALAIAEERAKKNEARSRRQARAVRPAVVMLRDEKGRWKGKWEDDQNVWIREPDDCWDDNKEDPKDPNAEEEEEEEEEVEEELCPPNRAVGRVLNPEDYMDYFIEQYKQFERTGSRRRDNLPYWETSILPAPRRAMRLYNKHVKESGGYDVDPVPLIGKHPYARLIDPIHETSLPEYEYLARFAVEAANRAKKDERLVYKRLVKMNWRVDGCVVMYMTLEVEDRADGKTKCCQTKILEKHGGGTSVLEFKLKPEAIQTTRLEDYNVASSESPL